MSRTLLINPYIHDFAAYDFWARPLGLMIMAGLLRDNGIAVEYLDLMDAQSPYLSQEMRPKRTPFGSGKFYRQPIPKPSFLPNIGRKFSRYGLPLEIARTMLDNFSKPDAVLVTSMMTYWYTGVSETIDLVKNKWPGVPVILGGVYATLCEAHARACSGADVVASGPAEQSLKTAAEVLGLPLAYIDSGASLPAHHFYTHAGSTAILTSRGCPFACPYCGIKTLHPKFVRYSLEKVLQEIIYIVHESKIRDIAIFDDALFADTERAIELFHRIADIETPVRLHAASGLSCRGLSYEAALAMKQAGFSTVRIGLETANPDLQKKLGGKVTEEEFHQAVWNLIAAGFERKAIGVYIMVGLPGQSMSDVERSVDDVLRLGIRPHLTEYSPVPGSPMFEEARAVSAYDLDEPLFHNPTLLPCSNADTSRSALSDIKLLIKARTQY